MKLINKIKPFIFILRYIIIISLLLYSFEKLYNDPGWMLENRKDVLLGMFYLSGLALIFEIYLKKWFK